MFTNVDTHVYFANDLSDGSYFVYKDNYITVCACLDLA